MRARCAYTHFQARLWQLGPMTSTLGRVWVLALLVCQVTATATLRPANADDIYSRDPDEGNCEVSSWSAWSTCMCQGCNCHGSMHQTRQVQHPGKQSGSTCPELFQAKPCVNADNCEVIPKFPNLVEKEHDVAAANAKATSTKGFWTNAGEQGCCVLEKVSLAMIMLDELDKCKKNTWTKDTAVAVAEDDPVLCTYKTSFKELHTNLKGCCSDHSGQGAKQDKCSYYVKSAAEEFETYVKPAFEDCIGMKKTDTGKFSCTMAKTQLAGVIAKLGDVARQLYADADASESTPAAQRMIKATKSFWKVKAYVQDHPKYMWCTKTDEMKPSHAPTATPTPMPTSAPVPDNSRYQYAPNKFRKYPELESTANLDKNFYCPKEFIPGRPGGFLKPESKQVPRLLSGR